MNKFDANELLVEAVLSNDLSLLKKALKNGADIDRLDDYRARWSCDSERTVEATELLFKAVISNDFPLLKKALKNGANIDILDKYAIGWSCAAGGLLVVKRDDLSLRNIEIPEEFK